MSLPGHSSQDFLSAFSSSEDSINSAPPCFNSKYQSVSDVRKNFLSKSAGHIVDKKMKENFSPTLDPDRDPDDDSDIEDPHLKRPPQISHEEKAKLITDILQDLEEENLRLPTSMGKTVAWSSTGVNMASTVVQERMEMLKQNLANKIVFKYSCNLNQKEISLLSDAYPNRRFIAKNNLQINAHAIAQVNRQLCTIELQILAEGELREGECIGCLGGNLFRELESDSNKHVCMPILDARDACRIITQFNNIKRRIQTIQNGRGRFVDRMLKWKGLSIDQIDENIKYLEQVQSLLFGKSIVKDNYSVNSVSICHNIFQNCSHQDAVVTAVDSIYDIPLNTLFEGMIRKNTRVMFATYMYAPECIFLEKGTLDRLGVEWFINGNRIEFFFKNDTANCYSHNFQTYKQYITFKPAYVYRGSTFYIEMVWIKIDVACIKISRMEGTLDIDHLIRKIQFPEAKRMVRISMPVCKQYSVKLYEQEIKYFPADLWDQVVKQISDPTSVPAVVALTHSSSYRMTLNGTTCKNSIGFDMSAEDMYWLAVAAAIFNLQLNHAAKATYAANIRNSKDVYYFAKESEFLKMLDKFFTVTVFHTDKKSGSWFFNTFFEDFKKKKIDVAIRNGYVLNVTRMPLHMVVRSENSNLVKIKKFYDTWKLCKPDELAKIDPSEFEIPILYNNGMYNPDGLHQFLTIPIPDVESYLEMKMLSNEINALYEAELLKQIAPAPVQGSESTEDKHVLKSILVSEIPLLSTRIRELYEDLVSSCLAVQGKDVDIYGGVTAFNRYYARKMWYIDCPYNLDRRKMYRYRAISEVLTLTQFRIHDIYDTYLSMWNKRQTVNPKLLHMESETFDLIISNLSNRTRIAQTYSHVFDGEKFVESDNLILGHEYLGGRSLNFFHEHELIANAVRAFEGSPMPDFEEIVILGLPGVGKTNFILEVAKEEHFVSTFTRRGCEEIINRKGRTSKNTKTVNSVIINGVNQKFDILFADESLMSHYGLIMLEALTLGIKKIIHFGDACQIPWVSYVDRFKDRFKELPNWIQSYTMNISRRIPADVCALLKDNYDYEIFTTNANRRSLKVVHGQALNFEPDPTVTYLTFTQNEKNSVITYLENKGFNVIDGQSRKEKDYESIEVGTVHSCQGITRKNVCLIRTNTVEIDIFKFNKKCNPWQLVAVSRHTDKFEYRTNKNGDSFAESLLKERNADVHYIKNNDKLLKRLKDVIEAFIVIIPPTDDNEATKDEKDAKVETELNQIKFTILDPKKRQTEDKSKNRKSSNSSEESYTSGSTVVGENSENFFSESDSDRPKKKEFTKPEPKKNDKSIDSDSSYISMEDEWAEDLVSDEFKANEKVYLKIFNEMMSFPIKTLDIPNTYQIFQNKVELNKQIEEFERNQKANEKIVFGDFYYLDNETAIASAIGYVVNLPYDRREEYFNVVYDQLFFRKRLVGNLGTVYPIAFSAKNMTAYIGKFKFQIGGNNIAKLRMIYLSLSGKSLSFEKIITNDRPQGFSLNYKQEKVTVPHCTPFKEDLALGNMYDFNELHKSKNSYDYNYSINPPFTSNIISTVAHLLRKYWRDKSFSFVFPVWDDVFNFLHNDFKVDKVKATYCDLTNPSKKLGKLDVYIITNPDKIRTHKFSTLPKLVRVPYVENTEKAKEKTIDDEKKSDVDDLKREKINTDEEQKNSKVKKDDCSSNESEQNSDNDRPVFTKINIKKKTTFDVASDSDKSDTELKFNTLKFDTSQSESESENADVVVSKTDSFEIGKFANNDKHLFDILKENRVLEDLSHEEQERLNGIDDINMLKMWERKVLRDYGDDGLLVNKEYLAVSCKLYGNSAMFHPNSINKVHELQKANAKTEIIDHTPRHGFVARTAFKLWEIFEAFPSLYDTETAIDFGAAPGSCTQFLKYLTHCKRVRSVIKPGGLEWKLIDDKCEYDCTREYVNDTIIETDKETYIQEFKNIAVGYDLVFCDIADDMKERDVDYEVQQNKLIDSISPVIMDKLRKGGNLILKSFSGIRTVPNVLLYFKHVYVVKPQHSLPKSSEIYYVAFNYCACLRQRTGVFNNWSQIEWARTYYEYLFKPKHNFKVLDKKIEERLELIEDVIKCNENFDLENYSEFDNIGNDHFKNGLFLHWGAEDEVMAYLNKKDIVVLDDELIVDEQIDVNKYIVSQDRILKRMKRPGYLLTDDLNSLRNYFQDDPNIRIIGTYEHNNMSMIYFERIKEGIIYKKMVINEELYDISTCDRQECIDAICTSQQDCYELNDEFICFQCNAKCIGVCEQCVKTGIYLKISGNSEILMREKHDRYTSGVNRCWMDSVHEIDNLCMDFERANDNSRILKGRMGDPNSVSSTMVYGTCTNNNCEVRVLLSNRNVEMEYIIVNNNLFKMRGYIYYAPLHYFKGAGKEGEFARYQVFTLCDDKIGGILQMKVRSHTEVESPNLVSVVEKVVKEFFLTDFKKEVLSQVATLEIVDENPYSYKRIYCTRPSIDVEILPIPIENFRMMRNILQTAYDACLPGVSEIDYRFDPYKVQHSDIMLTEVDSVDIIFRKFNRKRPHLKIDFEPYIKTGKGVDRAQTGLETLLGIYKRNVNPPKFQEPVCVRTLLEVVWDRFIHLFCVPEVEEFLEDFKKFKVIIDETYLVNWLGDCEEHKLRMLKTAGVKIPELLPMDKYELSIKKETKCKTDFSPISEYTKVQTVLASSKNVNLIYSGIFLQLMERLQMILKPNVIFNAGYTDKQLEDNLSFFWDPECEFLETDFTSFDKSLQKVAHEIKMMFYTKLGIDDRYLELWDNNHVFSTAVGFSSGVRMSNAYQTKSGDASTTLGNTIVNMAAMAYILHDREIKFFMALGDDNLVQLENPVVDEVTRNSLASQFNLEAKFLVTKEPVFCGRYLFHNGFKVRYMPDPLKRIEKFGNWNMDKDKIFETFISYKDLMNSYYNVSDNVLLAHQVSKRLKVEYDMTCAIGVLYEITRYYKIYKDVLFKKSEKNIY